MSAAKTKYGAADALALLAGADRLIAAKGQKVVAFDLAAARPPDDVLLTHLLGPTGTLRAPTARVGRTVLVGFHPDAWGEAVR